MTGNRSIKTEPAHFSERYSVGQQFLEVDQHILLKEFFETR